MMPVIRMSDATFSDLKSLSKWLETDTPSQTVVEIVRRTMEKLGLERDLDPQVATESLDGDVFKFDKAPGLSFTKPISVYVNGNEIKNPKWTTLLIAMIGEVKSKGRIGENLVSQLQVPARAGAYSHDGFKYYPELGISVQGQSAPDAWKEVERLSQKWHVPVVVKFRWRENQKAQHPGRTGILRSGGA